LPVTAQKNELSVGVGGYFPVNLTGVGNAVAIEGTFSRRFGSAPLASLYLELPVVATLNSSVRTFGLTSSSSYSSLFLAPGVKLKLAPGFFLSPWLAVGGGLAHFSNNSSLANFTGEGSRNTSVVDFGGGLDWKIAPFLSARGEARDFYSGGLGLSLTSLNERQHNLVTTLGLVLRF
jgi:hypothetical protein